MRIHAFQSPIDGLPLPPKFTYPFHYTPHPLCVVAAGEVQAYLSKQTQWVDEWRSGKMFGVLVVRKPDGMLGYLAAFSGLLAGKNIHPYFVPPVYDLQQPDGFFKQEEEQISALNDRIRALQEQTDYVDLLRQIEIEHARFEDECMRAKVAMKKAKEARDRRRQLGQTDEAEQAAMIRESQFQKAELKRMERAFREHIDQLRQQVQETTDRIESLKAERKSRSAALQQLLFRQFRFLNARGESKDLCDIFAETVQKVPPAGAGECAAPKLLQYAFLHDLHPVAMAEFWWGGTPKSEIRHHGYYYPACKGKCEPILGHMLQGLEVDDNPLLTDGQAEPSLEIVYEDDDLLVVNKPAGLLSVPGRESTDSVYARVRLLRPEVSGPLVVHRLDMATSGLLLVAKRLDVFRLLQAQFEERSVKKRYVALLDGRIEQKEGILSLPLSSDWMDRPRQKVDREQGKEAVTRYQVLKQTEACTLIAFYPLTGRTHQLRVHAAHADGLHCPILGDELYGRKADRLYLHAEYLEFTHPVSGRRLCLEQKSDFRL